MADENIEYTPEEMAEIQDLFEDLAPGRDPDTNPFIPLERQFQQEMEEIRSFLNMSSEAESPEDEAASGGTEETSGLADYISDIEKQSDEASPLPAPAADLMDDDFAAMDDLAETGDTDSSDFGGLDDLTADTGSETDDFAGLDDLGTPADTGADDFGGLDDLTADTGSGTDDFAGLDDLEAPADTGTDDFGGLDDLTADTGSGTDDFAGLDDLETPADTGTDDFGGLDDLAADAGSGTDDFAGLDDLGTAADTGTDDFGGLDDLTADSGSGDALDDFGGLDDLGVSESGPEGGDSFEDPDLNFAADGDDLSGFESSEDSTMDFGDLDGSDPFDGLSPEPLEATPTELDGSSGLLETGGSLLDSSDLADMTDQARMAQGIGDEFSDEDLAKIRSIIQDYPPGVKKAVIDSVVNEKISANDQRLLMNMLADEAEAETIAGFLETRVGYRPDTSPSQVRRDGVQIIYADGLNPEDISRKKKRARFMLLGAGLGLLGITLAFGAFSLIHFFSVKGLYEQGLEHLKEARQSLGDEKENHITQAEDYFSRALAKDGSYDLEYLNRYGIAYMKAGYHEQAFIKLFGKLSPDFAWSEKETRAPLLRAAEGSSWPGSNPPPGSPPLYVVGRDGVKRDVLIPGAYIVSRIRDESFDRRTLMNLGRFHSQNTKDFVNPRSGSSYKNDELAIDYYRLVLTLMDRPDDTEVMAGIGKVHYDAGNYAAAAREYNRILDIAPMDVQGHAGLLNTYLEIWKREKDPRYVIARHRLVRNLGLEDDLPIYLLTKLAGFYIDLDRDTLRIRYQVDPVDSVSGLDIEDNVIHLLKLAFTTQEQRDDEKIVGSRYGEGFYQRGRYLMAIGDSLRALKQFQNAHMYDDKHYLAINAMGEYYMSNLDYERAEDYFKEALRTNQKYKDTYGSRPEDETLIEGDTGRVYYNLASLIYLRYAGMPEGSQEGFPDTRIYPDRALNVESSEMEKRRERLRTAKELYQKSLEDHLKDPAARIETTYRIGWIDYISGDFESALRSWEELETSYAGGYSDPALVLGRGNAYYYTEQNRSALGSYLKIKDDLQRTVDSISRPNPDDLEHRKVFLTLSAVHNNLGAVYEREHARKKEEGADERSLTELEKNALLHYWQAVEMARKVDSDNEIARTNIEMSFKRTKEGNNRGGSDPLLDDWVPPITSAYGLPGSKGKS